MDQTELAPDIVYSGRRGAWFVLILLALFDGGMLLVCSPVWDAMTSSGDPEGADAWPLLIWPVALLPFAILAAGVAWTILAGWRAWNGRPRLILRGGTLTYQGVFRVRQARWSELDEFILWLKREDVTDDSGIGSSTQTVETSWLTAPMPGRRRSWRFWRQPQFRTPDSFDVPLKQIQAELNRHVGRHRAADRQG